EPPATARLERPEREQGERHAEREREGGREDEAGPDDGERAARPARRRAELAPADDGEGERCGRDGCDGQEPDPEQRREGVVEQAVGDERVPARVPEVVPEDEAVMDEERPLVEVRGQVASRRAGPDEDRRDERGRPGDERSLTREWRRAGHLPPL